MSLLNLPRFIKKRLVKQYVPKDVLNPNFDDKDCVRRLLKEGYSGMFYRFAEEIKSGSQTILPHKNIFSILVKAKGDIHIRRVLMPMADDLIYIPEEALFHFEKKDEFIDILEIVQERCLPLKRLVNSYNLILLIDDPFAEVQISYFTTNKFDNYFSQVQLFVELSKYVDSEGEMIYSTNELHIYPNYCMLLLNTLRSKLNQSKEENIVASNSNLTK